MKEDIIMSIFILEATVIVLSLLSIRIKLWKKSISVFMILMTCLLIVLLHNILSKECFVSIAPLVGALSLFIIVGRGIFKKPDDRFMGGFALDL